jgi:SAM-dependent methyltransferase
MKVSEAASFIAPAIHPGSRTWADFGAGEGTFTRALASLLGPSARIHAVERDAAGIAALEALADERISVIRGDFTNALELPRLDGALFANALHFVPASRQATVLSRIARGMEPGGRVVFVEYDRRTATQWVPYPIPPERLRGITLEAGLGAPIVVGTRPSAYSGTLFAAYAIVPATLDGLLASPH